MSASKKQTFVWCGRHATDINPLQKNYKSATASATINNGLIEWVIEDGRRNSTSMDIMAFWIERSYWILWMLVRHYICLGRILWPKKLLRATAYQVENYSLLERFEEANVAASLLAITSHKQTTAMVIGVITLIGMLNFASELYPTLADYWGLSMANSGC